MEKSSIYDIQHEELQHQQGASTSPIIGDEEAAKVLKANINAQAFDRVEEAQVIRKIDWIMMPIMGITFGLFIIDKAIIGIGTLFGLLADLDLAQVSQVNGKKVIDTGRYANVTLIFYVGYLVGAYPLTQLAQRYPIAKMASLYTLFWGITVICFPACSSYAGVMTQRFAQGFFESGVLPTYGLMIGMWYTKSEQALRNPLWYSLGFSAGALGTVISYGLVHIQPSGLKIWQLLYIFWGAVTMAWGILAYLILPNSQGTMRGLTERQRYIAVERLRTNQDTVQNHHFKKDQVWETLLDVRVWVLGCLTFLVVCPTAMATTFAPIIFTSMGFDTYTIVVMSAPGAVVGTIFGILGGYIGMKVRNSRVYVAVCGMLFVIVGLVILWKVPRSNSGPALFGAFLMYCYAGVIGQVLTFVPTNCGGSTKKSIASGVVYVFYCAGNIASPLFFRATDAPDYNSGVLAVLICSILSVFVGLAYRFLLATENKRRDKIGDEAREDHAFEDLTDRQNLSFRYAL